MQAARVQSLVKEQGSQMPRDVVKEKKHLLFVVLSFNTLEMYEIPFLKENPQKRDKGPRDS